MNTIISKLLPYANIGGVIKDSPHLFQNLLDSGLCQVDQGDTTLLHIVVSIAKIKEKKDRLIILMEHRRKCNKCRFTMDSKNSSGETAVDYLLANWGHWRFQRERDGKILRILLKNGCQLPTNCLRGMSVIGPNLLGFLSEYDPDVKNSLWIGGFNYDLFIKLYKNDIRSLYWFIEQEKEQNGKVDCDRAWRLLIHIYQVLDYPVYPKLRPMIKYLLDHIPINMTDNLTHKTLLRYLIDRCLRLVGFDDAIKDLLLAGSDPRIPDNNGNSPLSIVIKNTELRKSELLLSVLKKEEIGSLSFLNFEFQAYSSLKQVIILLTSVNKFFSGTIYARGLRNVNSDQQERSDADKDYIVLIDERSPAYHFRAKDVENQRKELRDIRFGLIRDRVTEICLGLYGFRLPGLQTLAIVDASLPIAERYTNYEKMQLILAVKYFCPSKKERN